MYYVYILKDRVTEKIYIGYTSDLRTRVSEHNKRAKSWVLVYYEAYRCKKDALIREKRLKYYGKALSQLKKRIENSLFDEA